jgi:hypothetical protein
MRILCILLAVFLFGFTQILKKPVRKLASEKSSAVCDMREAQPRCWKARSEAVIEILLVHYGSEMDEMKLSSIAKLYEERFALATAGKVKVHVHSQLILPLKEMKRDLESIKHKIGGGEENKSTKRLERLWYYYQDISIADEIESELQNSKVASSLAAVDAVVVLSAPQIDGLAYLSGAYSIIEYPTEIAWKLSDGGTTTYETNFALVDKMVHETGHLLGIDHPSDHCQVADLKERAACCQASPSGKDVMSYCRARDSVSEKSYFVLSECTLNYLTETILPSILSGGQRLFQDQNCL